MPTVTLAPAPDAATLAAEWRGLAQRSTPSFFQSWHWTGCLYAERFDDPLLLAARDADGEPLALGLLNRRGGRLFLGESGRPALDAVFIEHNGLLLARAAPRTLAVEALAPLARHHVMLSGIGDALCGALAALPGALRTHTTRAAPYVDYAALPAGPFLASLSANTRYQIRRSERSYAGRGPLAIRRAASEAEAHGFLDALATLHQRYWQGRGRPGAFAEPAFGRFHHTLIGCAWTSGGVDLLRIEAGDSAVGYLYNFVANGDVSAYQSGFDYAAAGAYEKPGLTSHALAITHYREAGMRRYDFLAGEDRYKTSLANATRSLHWVEYMPRYSAGWAAASLRAALGR